MLSLDVNIPPFLQGVQGDIYCSPAFILIAAWWVSLEMVGDPKPLLSLDLPSHSPSLIAVASWLSLWQFLWLHWLGRLFLGPKSKRWKVVSVVPRQYSLSFFHSLFLGDSSPGALILLFCPMQTSPCFESFNFSFFLQVQYPHILCWNPASPWTTLLCVREASELFFGYF